MGLSDPQDRIPMKTNASSHDLPFICLVIVTYMIVFSLIYYIRYLDFFTSNWDLGIEMQMLYSTGHGLILYEAGDFQTYGVLSHLEIHSTYIAIPVAYLFQIFRSALFLYVMQAFFISIAIIPLRKIAAISGISRKAAFFLIAVYLLNFPLIASSFYDFHWMSLMPFLLFSLFVTVKERRFYSSISLVVIGTLTLEVFPFLALGILLYFYLENSGLRVSGIIRNIKKKESILLYGIAILSISSYVIVTILQTRIIPGLLDNAAGIANVETYSTQSLYPVSFHLMEAGDSLFYWLILYSAFGFIPFLYPKHLILNIPWLYESIFLMPRYAGIADQYNFIAIPALVIGLAFGLKKIEASGDKRLVYLIPLIAVITVLVMIAANGFTITGTSPARIILMAIGGIAVNATFYILLKRVHLKGTGGNLRRSLITARKFSLVVLLVLLLAFNVAMSPLNTHNDSNTPDSGYAFSYSLNPEYPKMQMLVSMIPGNSTVVASDNLFPYVASDSNALSFYWRNLSNIGYPVYVDFSNGSNAAFILVDQSEYYLIPSSVISEITNPAEYGLYAAVYSNLSYPGNIYLYEKSYSGNAKIFSG